MDLFEKKKDEISKKAKKIASIYEAEVSIILISSEKLFVYTTPNSTMKKIIDQYQNTVGVDLWSTHFEKMEEELRRLKDINTTLRRVIMEGKNGEELDDLNMEQLCNLEDEMILALRLVRDRKYRVLNNQVEVYKKKVRNLEDMQFFLINRLERHGNRKWGVVEDDGSVSDAALAVQHLRLQGDEDETSSTAAAAMEVEDSA